MTQKQTAGISILLCTFNGSQTIVHALSALACSENPPLSEIILVDNASTDGVSERALSFWGEEQRFIPLRVVHEATPGKSFAIRSGVRHALYDFILICDDDNALATDYLRTAAEIMGSDDSIGCLGGAALPRIIGKIPAHFYNFAPWFAVGAQIRSPEEAEQMRVDIGTKHIDMPIWGAGAVFRKEDLLRLYALPKFPLISGQHKCEDIELCHVVALMGRRLIYTPKLTFEHVIFSERLAASRLIRRYKYDELNQGIIDAYVECRRVQKEGILSGPLKAVRRYLLGKLAGHERPERFLLGAWLKLGVTAMLSQSELDVLEISRALTSIPNSKS
jgi:glycosyltransferase involved in cell wall biosynthesis